MPDDGTILFAANVGVELAVGPMRGHLRPQSHAAWTDSGNSADAIMLRNSSHRLSARTNSSTSRLALSANSVKKSAADTQLARPAVVCTTGTPACGARRK